MARVKRYAVWGVDRSYRWLWVACLVTGIKAAKRRWTETIDRQ